VKHYHVYDTTGEVMCVDAVDWCFDVKESCAWFYDTDLGEGGKTVATFNWSNVVCVREEEDDDDDISSTPVPDYLQGVLN
jgi:hypothetical protein